MKWMVWTLVVLVSMIGVVAIVGYFLPVNHQASRSADFTQPPAAVFALLSDLDRYPTWWPENDVRSEIVESAPPSHLVTRIVGQTAFGGTWTMEIVPIATGSHVTITERGEVYNLIFRTLARFVFGYTGTMDQCLAAAKKTLRA
jgi:hypothetical protein